MEIKETLMSSYSVDIYQDGVPYNQRSICSDWSFLFSMAVEDLEYHP